MEVLVTVKRIVQVLAVTAVMFLVGCTKEVPADKVVIRQGIAYEVNSQTPFTGIEVSYHENGQLWFKHNRKDGKRHGLYEKYEEDGTIKSGFPKCYQNGKKVDLSICKQ